MIKMYQDAFKNINHQENIYHFIYKKTKNS